jgi:hypothetical protein
MAKVGHGKLTSVPNRVPKYHLVYSSSETRVPVSRHARHVHIWKYTREHVLRRQHGACGGACAASSACCVYGSGRVKAKNG